MIRALLLSCLLLPFAAGAAHAQEDPPDSAEAPAPPPAPRGRLSLISDRRVFTVGDVLTIMVDEFTLASANLGNVHSDDRQSTRDANLSVTTPASTTGGRLGMNTTNNGRQTQRGEAVRQNRFQSEMTVRVIEVLPGGVLRVEGTKVLDIDKNRQEVKMSGFVRSQDIGPFNQVDSWRVAELQLNYKNDGALGKPKSSIIGRLFGAIWP